MATYAFGKTHVTKKCYEIAIRVSDSLPSSVNLSSGYHADSWDSDQLFNSVTAHGTLGDWARVGRTESSPKITGEDGEEIKLNNCDDHLISENLTIEFNIVEFTAANYTAMRDALSYGNIDILFWDPDNLTESVVAYDINLRAKPQIEGNALNKIVCMGKKEVSNIDNHFKMITVALS